MYSDKEHCMCKPNKYDTTSLPIHQAGRNIGMSAALPKWLAKYESHSNIFNEMTAKHSALFLVICFTSEKNTAILCGVQFLLMYYPPSPVIQYPAQPHFLDAASHSACGAPIGTRVSSALSTALLAMVAMACGHRHDRCTAGELCNPDFSPVAPIFLEG